MIGSRRDEVRADHGGEADAAAGEDRDAVAGPDVGAARHRHHAGGDAAAEQAGEIEVERGIDRQRAVRGHDRVARERRDVGKVVDELTVAREPASAVAQEAGVEAGRGIEAEVGASLEAEAAGAAGGREREDDPLADACGIDALTDLLDHPCALVPEHHRHRHRPLAVDVGESLRQMPVAAIRTSTSSRRGGASSRSATSSGRFGAVKTAARILMRASRGREEGRSRRARRARVRVSISRSYGAPPSTWLRAPSMAARAELVQRHADRRQRHLEVLGQRVVVVADQRHVAGHPDPRRRTPASAPTAWFRFETNTPVGGRAAPSSSPPRAAAALLERRLDDAGTLGPAASAASTKPCTRRARGVELRRPGDMAEPAVAERDQVLGGQPPGVLLAHRHVAPAARLAAVHEHAGHVALGEELEDRAAGPGARDQQAVDAALARPATRRPAGRSAAMSSASSTT